jgi:hypothetical protein
MESKTLPSEVPAIASKVIQVDDEVCSATKSRSQVVAAKFSVEAHGKGPETP